MSKSEFRVANQHRYDRRSPVRWIVSHTLRYPYIPAAVLAVNVLSNLLGARAPLIVGAAFDQVLSPGRSAAALLALSISYLSVRLGQSLLGLVGNSTNEVLSQRVERDARDELYAALLGKSLTFHSRQRVGDLMARATNDVRQLNYMFSPGLRLILSSGLSLVIPVITIATIDSRLLLVPLLFTVALVITIRRYSRQLDPVLEAQREQFGTMNAGLAEAVSGIEVVKANAQEPAQLLRFLQDARGYRDLSVRQGE
ncbi:MAG: ABC transporter transmembrane domain-containing protein, partial [Anaerolineae bacterium]